jgi:hypothetical protein
MNNQNICNKISAFLLNIILDFSDYYGHNDIEAKWTKNLYTEKSVWKMTTE